MVAALWHSRGPRALWLPPVLLLVLPLLQLIPLPYALWSQLPGRAELAAGLQTAGVPPHWAPWSLAPFDTERLLEALLLPAGVYMAALRMSGAERRQLLGLVLAFAGLSVVLGLFQLLEGADSSLYFYAVTNRGDAVGLFANRNHLASLLAAALPPAAGMLVDHLRHHRHGPRDLRVWLLTALIVLLAVGVTASQSRAAFLLLMLSVAASAVVLWRGRRQVGYWGGSEHWLRVSAALALVLILQYTLYALLLRLQVDPLADMRWQFAAQSLQVAAGAHGSGYGLGSFLHAYDLIGDVSASRLFYVNHVHNDYIELWLEGGVPALLLMLLGLGALGWQLRQQWRARVRSHHRGLELGAACALLLLLLHSLVDYPLRTVALQCVAALLVAVLVGAVLVGARSSPDESSRP